MRLNRLYSLYLVFFCGLLFPGRLGAQTPSAGDWSVGSAIARYTVEVDAKAPPSPLTYAGMYIVNPRWAVMPIGVFNDSGQRVASQIVSYAPGEKLVLLFDSSSNAKHFDIYFGATDLPPLPLKDDHAGVHLESRLGEGKEIDKLPDMLDAWNKAADKVEGKAMVPGIFEGGNRFGPQRNLLLHFHAWCPATANEHVDFAVVSTDSAFLLVDGKEVVDWPGAHDVGGGVQAQHQAGVDLTAGVHEIDYYNDYFQAGGPPLLACLAVKGGPLDKWTMLQSDAPFLVPAAEAKVIDYAVTNASAPPLTVDYVAKAQSVIEDTNPDIGFITLTLSCLPAQDGTVTWTFDDGTTATGQTVDHLFPRPGLRTVQVQVADSSNSVRPVQQLALRIHPDWHLLTTSPPDLALDAQKDILSRDPATMSASDLVGCAAVFGTYQAKDALIKIEPALSAQMKNVADADLIYVKIAANLLAPDLTQAKVTMPLLQALVDRCGTSPTPAVAPVSGWARIALGELTLLTTSNTDAVKSLLAGVSVPALTGDDHRRYDILLGDLAVATGDVAAGRKKYDDLSGNPQGPDARSGVRMTGRIGQARVFLDRKDYESAEDALREVAWTAPIDKLTADYALTRLRLFEEEKLPDIALIYAKRLLPVITTGERSELLYRLTDLAAQQGDKALAGKTLAELLQKHAYSEEAAKAKAKWPGGV